MKLCELLENQLTPEFYHGLGVTERWLQKMAVLKSSLKPVLSWHFYNSILSEASWFL